MVVVFSIAYFSILKVSTLDAFTHSQTRLVVMVDGLDSCENQKMLQLLDVQYSLALIDTTQLLAISGTLPVLLFAPKCALHCFAGN